MISYLGQAVAHLCGVNHTSARAIAQKAGLHPTLLTRACHGSRLETKSLRALCTSQDCEEDSLTLMVSHLRDEIDRAGQSQVKISILTDDIIARQEAAIADYKKRIHDIMVRSHLALGEEIPGCLTRSARALEEPNAAELKRRESERQS